MYISSIRTSSCSLTKTNVEKILLADPSCTPLARYYKNQSDGASLLSMSATGSIGRASTMSSSSPTRFPFQNSSLYLPIASYSSPQIAPGIYPRFYDNNDDDDDACSIYSSSTLSTTEKPKLLRILKKKVSSTFKRCKYWITKQKLDTLFK